jgi:hypothetical protein
VIRQTRFNVPNLPLFVNGTRPFLGDYVDMAAQTIVPSGGTYKFNTGNNSPSQAGGFKPIFHAAWTDDRDVVPPKQRNPDGTANWANYQPLFNLDAASGAVSANAAACTTDPVSSRRVNNGQSGNRDQNVFTAVIGESWTAFANATAKSLTLNGSSAPRGFVITVRNFELRAAGRFQLTATPGAGATASFVYPGLGAASATAIVDVAPRSSSTRTLWVTSANSGATITVQVQNVGAPGDATTIVLNPDPAETLVGSADGNADLANNNLWYPNSAPGVGGLTNAITFNELANNELANVELANVELANAELANAELANVELANVELANNELANAELANVELANNELANNELANNELANNELANNELANNELANNELANNELANGPVIESTVIVKNSGNTDTTLAVKPILRALPTGAKLQLVLRKIAVTPVVGTSCVPNLVERNAQVANIPSPRTYTPDTVDNKFPDVTSETGAATLPLSVNELAQVTLRIAGHGLPADQALDFGRWGTKFVVVDAKPNTVTTVPLVIKTFVLPAVQANVPAPGVTIPAAPNGLQAIGGAPGSGLAWTIESVMPQQGFPSLPPTASIAVDPSLGALTVTNVPPGKYDLIVSVRDCATTACSVPRQYDLQKLTLTVTSIPASALPPAVIQAGASVTLGPATSGSGDPVAYTAPIFSPPLPANDCTVTAAGSPGVYTLTAGSAPGVCTVIVWSGGATIQLSVAVTTTIAVKSTQTITFGPAPTPTYSPGGSVSVLATTTSHLAVSYSSSTTGVCTVNSSTGQVAILTAGDCIIAADQPGDGTYLAAAQASQKVTISKAPQNIVFNALAPRTYGDAPFTISATGGGSPNPVTFSSAGKCGVSGSTAAGSGSWQATVSITGAGACTLTASQAGDTNYLAAVDVAQGFVIAQAAQTIAFGPLADKTFGDAPFMVGATGGASGNPVTFTSNTAAGLCTVSGNVVTIVAAGSCTIIASQAGNSDFLAATAVSRTFTVNQAAQTITFPTVPAQTYSFGATVAISATAKSGATPTNLLVSFAASGNCTVSSSTLTAGTSTATVNIMGAGSCTLTASQAGNGNYGAATPVVQSFSVAKASQTITFGPLPDVRLPAAPFALSATASSGLTVVFTSSTTSICTVSGNTVTLVKAGTCTLAADQPGDANYSPASQVLRSFAVLSPWVATGALLQPRSYHTATLLNDGKVLVTGGFDASGASTATAELYDPAAGSFTSVGNLPSKSAAHTATLLSCACASNGKVLVTGGGNSSAEIYDPSTRTWSGTGGIGGNRSYHTATVLQSNKVLIVGGADNAGKTISSTLIFDPVTGSFANGPALSAARERHVAMLLADGRVLIAGGRAKSGNGYTVIASAEIYSPATGAFTSAGNMAAGRYSASVALLNDGRVLVAGGSNDTTGTSAGALNTAELYTPSTGLPGTWTVAAQTPVLSAQRKEFTLTTLLDGRALAAGGQNIAGRLNSAELYSLATGAAGVFAAAPPMLTARSGHTATRLVDGRVLVVGGVGTAGSSITAAEYYQPGP